MDHVFNILNSLWNLRGEQHRPCQLVQSRTFPPLIPHSTSFSLPLCAWAIDQDSRGTASWPALWLRLEKVSVWERGRECAWEVEREDKWKLEKLSEAVRKRERERETAFCISGLEMCSLKLQFGMWEDESDAGFAYAHMIGPNAYSDMKT